HTFVPHLYPLSLHDALPILRRGLLGLRDDRPDVTQYSAEISAPNSAINIDYRDNVVVRVDGLASDPCYVSYIIKDLTVARSRFRGTKRHRPQLGKRSRLTFRYPDIDEILDASGIIEPVGRSPLPAAAHREQHRPSHISFAEAELHRLCSINVELESLPVVWLLNTYLTGS